MLFLINLIIIRIIMQRRNERRLVMTCSTCSYGKDSGTIWEEFEGDLNFRPGLLYCIAIFGIEFHTEEEMNLKIFWMLRRLDGIKISPQNEIFLWEMKLFRNQIICSFFFFHYKNQQKIIPCVCNYCHGNILHFPFLNIRFVRTYWSDSSQENSLSQKIR